MSQRGLKAYKDRLRGDVSKNRILYFLGRLRSPATAAELAKDMSVSPSTLSSTLNKLFKSGQIQRIPGHGPRGGYGYTLPQTRFWIQEWEESERGWGTRPDGFTVHSRKEDIQSFLEEMRRREMGTNGAGYVPDCYTRPMGEPFEAEVEPSLRPKPGTNGCWLPSSWRRP